MPDVPEVVALGVCSHDVVRVVGRSGLARFVDAHDVDRDLPSGNAFAWMVRNGLHETEGSHNNLDGLGAAAVLLEPVGELRYLLVTHASKATSSLPLCGKSGLADALGTYGKLGPMSPEKKPQQYQLTMEEAELEERDILDRAREVVKHQQRRSWTLDDVELVGQYPDTDIRVTATREGKTRSHDWPIWDGSMIGGPPGVVGSAEYIQMLFTEVDYWLRKPRWE